MRNKGKIFNLIRGKCEKQIICAIIGATSTVLAFSGCMFATKLSNKNMAANNTENEQFHVVDNTFEDVTKINKENTSNFFDTEDEKAFLCATSESENKIANAKINSSEITNYNELDAGTNEVGVHTAYMDGETVITDGAMLMERESETVTTPGRVWYYAIGAYERLGATEYKAEKVKTITLQNTLTPPTAYTNASSSDRATWDASYTNGAGTVTAWIVKNADDSTMYDFYLGAAGKIYAPENSDSLFKLYSKCENIFGLEYLDTSLVKNMEYMFDGCYALLTLDVSNFDTGNVTDMHSMFGGCNSLPILDVTGFNTTKVTNMRSMFSRCKSLLALDITGFNTSNVTNMCHMFDYCSSLTNLDVTTLNTSKVTNMYGMFSYCRKLESLDVSNFDTGNVTDMSSMFDNCYIIQELDLSNFNTIKTTDMSSMFSFCRGLKNLNISSFNTSNVTNMRSMFSYCYSIAEIDVSGFNTSNVRDMRYMFSECYNLSHINVSNFVTNNVTDMAYMFNDCTTVAELNVSGFNTSKVTDMTFMFDSCIKVEILDVSGFDTSKVTRMEGMFSRCKALTKLDVSKFDTSKVLSFGGMFYQCENLLSLDLRNFDTSSLDGKTYSMSDTIALGVDTTYMLTNCKKLESIILGEKFNRLDRI